MLHWATGIGMYAISCLKMFTMAQVYAVDGFSENAFKACAKENAKVS